LSFTQKVLKFSFSGAQSGNFSAAGLRAAANIQRYQGRSGTIAQVKIWGLSMAQMNAYSSVIPAAVAAEQFNLIIEAGDLGGQLSLVINGAILRSFIDLTGAPESVFNVTVIDTYLASNPIEAQSTGGTQDAETLIANVCAAANLTFDNSAGAHGVLDGQSTYGSAIDQIDRIATAAKFNWKITTNGAPFLPGSTISIWPKDGTVDDVVVNVGPNTSPKMVGYPGYWEAGLIVTSLYNPQIQLGRQMNVTSSIPKANGRWQIIQVQDELTTMLAKGPWFTTAILAPIGS
jgi:hypothetical protein